MSILITGGVGAIGSNTARGLMARGEKVVIFDRVEPAEDNRILGDFKDMFEVETGNCADMATLLNVATRHQVKGIIHFAAMLPPHDNDLHPLDAINTNIVATASILEIARSLQLERVLVASAAGVMGRPDDLETPRREEDVSLPLGGIYPLCKLACEQLVNTYRRLYGLRATAFRPRNVYGPGANPRIQPLFESFFAALAGEDVVRESGGDSIFDYTYVKDISGAIADLYSFEGEDNYVYNLSRGRGTTMAEAFTALQKAFPEQRIEVGPGPWEGVVEGGKELELTVHPAVMPPQDVSRATRDFGYQPVWDIEEGVADWARWYRTGEYEA